MLVRHWERWMAVVGLAALAGCAELSSRRAPPPAPAASSAAAQRFFAEWNANAQKIDSVLCEHVDIDGSSQGQIYSLSGKLAFQKPHGFRLTGRALGKTEVDVGSNSREIWFWIARSEPPAVYFCRREDLPEVNSTIPFHPDWLGEALGLTPLDPGRFRPGESGRDYFTLISNESAPGRFELYRRLVVDRRNNRLAALEFFDGSGRRLAELALLEYLDDPAGGRYLPRRLRIEFPETQTVLTFGLRQRSVRFDGVSPELAQSVFQRGEYAGSREVNLAAQVRQRTLPGVAREGTRTDPQVRPAQGAAVELQGEIEALPPSGSGGN